MTIKDNIIAFTIKQFEGGKVNNSADRGGVTNFGITRPFLAWYHGVQANSITPDMINNMTLAQAEEIYGWAYDQYGVARLPDSVQHIFWDMCVNSGVGNATKIMQRAVTMLKYNVGTIDGKMGFNTNKALHDAETTNAQSLMQSIVFNRISFYKQIVINDPTQRVFLNGWINRANWFLTNSIT